MAYSLDAISYGIYSISYGFTITSICFYTISHGLYAISYCLYDISFGLNSNIRCFLWYFPCLMVYMLFVLVSLIFPWAHQ